MDHSSCVYPVYLPQRAKNMDFYLKCGRGVVGKREDMVRVVGRGFRPAGGEDPATAAISSGCCAAPPGGAA